MLNTLAEQAPILALAINSISGNLIIANVPEAVTAIKDDEYGDAFRAIQAASSKRSAASKYEWSSLFRATVAAAAKSKATISNSTTISKTEYKTKCELTAIFTLGFPTAGELREEFGEDGDKFDHAFDIIRTLKQQRTFEAYYDDEGELLVRVFDPE